MYETREELIDDINRLRSTLAVVYGYRQDLAPYWVHDMAGLKRLRSGLLAIAEQRQLQRR